MPRPRTIQPPIRNASLKTINGLRPMMPKEFEAALDTLGISPDMAPLALGLSARHVQRIAAGFYVPPPAVAKVLRMALDGGFSGEELTKY